MLVMNYLKKERDKFFYRLRAHGFQVLSKEALILYKCTNFYSPKDERGILWNDPFLNIDWPNNNPVVNEKDLKYPLFNDILKNGDFFE